MVVDAAKDVIRDAGRGVEGLAKRRGVFVNISARARVTLPEYRELGCLGCLGSVNRRGRTVSPQLLPAWRNRR